MGIKPQNLYIGQRFISLQSKSNILNYKNKIFAVAPMMDRNDNTMKSMG